MRIKHYLKNVLIFFPLVFSGKLADPDYVLPAILSFLSFSLICSAVYVINDMFDVGSDRLHQTKRHRPLPSGQITMQSAGVFAGVLAVCSFILNYLAGRSQTWSWLILALYLFCNLAYSWKLKHVPILDITILAFCYVGRVFYGSSVMDIPISGWMYLTVIAASFYLGLGKRRNELQQENGGTRRVLQFYNHGFLDKNLYICMALTITFYALWCVDPVTIEKHDGVSFLWTVPLVIIICMKYSLNVEGRSDGDPVEVVFKDKLLLVLIALFGLLTLGNIYISRIL